ncbi:TWiK family of potassium channels protein 18 [Caenorhabditis elegans]|uniref:TWiK family of potassium channels protein 18 n=1 Tax=Caenorhabditis elegans TaxID=6239 RepID=TWK18_CAEEL|nr:TWiK family of potassium channels protein 18 [Caenorhabditis elegans]Q18120.2 RecName: Full=TWiK family of potassium channels protein 18 [Caenorhabditis elegans]AAC32861.1 potassium channel subunit n2P18 [Caenorhabditis elegans]CCD65384.1 TWiK family of potassium channels protein 18 [Caenorhabditis elegans]|eukprot:NP_509516.1 TWiK family of potassium channels protein 18 [Caenorhabditis elegans]
MAIVAQGVSTILTTFQKTFKGLLPLIILVAYTLLGAWIFWMIEGENEREMLIEQQKERDELIRRTVYKINQLQIKRQRRLMTAEEEYNRTAKVLTTFQETLGIVPADMDKDIHWTFLGSIFYCMTVYTTIGYGNIVPGTGWGRFATILYAFIGIPLTVLSLYCLGSLFAKGCKMLWRFFLKSTRVVSKDLSNKISEAADNIEEGTTAITPSAEKTENNDDDLLSFPISGLLLITVIWVIFCAVLFTFLEEWDFGTSLYFTLISFTTIGFGDILPSDYDFMPIVGVLLLIGLSLVSTVMTLIQQQIEALASGMKDNIDQEYARALNEAREDGEVDEHVDPEEDPENNKKSFDAVISRMNWSKRGLYYLLPDSQKKELAKQSEKKMGRKSIKIQTDNDLLETLIREEILKAELNNEMHKYTAPRSSHQPKLVYSDVREKEVPIEVVRVEHFNHGNEDYLEHDI